MIEEVLKDLKNLSKKGAIKAVGNGSNAIGKTLQSELGIEHSTTSRNSYKGFIVSSSSTKVKRSNLFSSVPDWEKSEIKSSKEMLDLYGVDDHSGKYEKKLFCSVNSLEPNSFGLYLEVDKSSKILSEKYYLNNQRKFVTVWDKEKLINKLSRLDKTVIVSANVLRKGEINFFHFRFAEFLLRPSLGKFIDLVDYGSISMDHLISLKKGSKNVREQGPLFKISKASKKDLFSEYKKFDLMD